MVRTATVPAFHTVAYTGPDYESGDHGRLLDRIVEAGALIPLIDRLTAGHVRWVCHSLFRSSRRTRQAIASVIEKNVLPYVPFEEGEVDTHISCLDLLFGDAFYIWLSPWQWFAYLPQKEEQPNGFVFDAELLVENGAVLRPWSFRVCCFRAIRKWAYERRAERSVEKLEVELKALIEGIQSKWQFSGRDATAFLSPKAREKFPYPELLYPGPLGVTPENPALLEIWRNGELAWSR